MARPAAKAPKPAAPSETAARGPREGVIAAEHLGAAIEYYQTAVQVQQHYNEMLIKLRSLGLTGAATLLAVAGGAAAGATPGTAPDQTLALFGEVRLQVSGVFAFCALLLTVGLFVMDRLYYYRLFIAAVKNAVAFEVDNRAALAAIGVRRNPMILHLVMTVPQAWSNAFVVIYWAAPALISLLFLVAAVR